MVILILVLEDTKMFDFLDLIELCISKILSFFYQNHIYPNDHEESHQLVPNFKKDSEYLIHNSFSRNSLKEELSKLYFK